MHADSLVKVDRFYWNENGEFTERPKGGKFVPNEVRFTVYDQADGPEVKRKAIRQGMIRKVGVDRYQFAGYVFEKKGDWLMFGIYLSEEELRSFLQMPGAENFTLRYRCGRRGHQAVIYGKRFYFKVKEFLQEEVEGLIKKGSIARARKPRG